MYVKQIALFVSAQAVYASMKKALNLASED